MPSNNDIASIQRLLSNRLDQSSISDKLIAGVMGDSPSHYSKSPVMWNAAFGRLAIDAIYLPFDVDDSNVGPLLNALRSLPRFMGINVTVPHKVRVIQFLDELDADAARVGAVNTVVKNHGKLSGYNTDGAGFIDSLLLPPPGNREPFIDSLDGMDVLLLGAGGSARAVAFHLSDHIGAGKLIVANRTRAHAEQLANEIAACGRHAIAIDEAQVSLWARQVGLIVNCTTKGQGGIRKLTDGKTTILEPYSALASAKPPAFVNDAADFEARWRKSVQQDIETNNQSSLTLIQSIPPSTRFYDLIYHPDQTVFLNQAERTGHRTMNGKSMIVRQAALAFCKHICLSNLKELGKDDDDTVRAIADIMFGAWQDRTLGLLDTSPR
jgi:shikimate dehydrogenase